MSSRSMKALKKVVHMTTVHLPLNHRIFYKQAKTVSEAGYETVLISQHTREEDEIVDGVKILALPEPRNRWHRVLGLGRKACSLAMNEDALLYHFHDPELIPLGLFLKYFKKAKVVYDVHENTLAGIRERPWIPRGTRTVIAICFDIFERAAARLFDGIVCATDDIATRFKGRNVIPVRNYPILNIPDSETENRRNQHQPKLIYAGRIHGIRGIAEMVRAMEFLSPPWNEVRLELLGSFPREDPDFEIEVTQMEGFQRVNYRGWVPYTEVPRYMSEASIGLLPFLPHPNHFKAQPNKLFDYMQAGLALIVSDFPLWRDLVTRYRCGIAVDPCDPQKIADAIRYLLERPDLVKEMGRNAKQAAEQHFSWQGEAERLVTLYDSLLK